MKIKVFRLFVGILTLFVGIFSAWFLSSILQATAIEVDEAMEIETATEVVVKNTDKIPIIPDRFSETFRACKPGYLQGYITNDGQEVSEGNGFCNLENSEAVKTVYETRIKNAKRVVESKKGRVVLEIEDNYLSYFEILEYEDGSCIRFYKAPTLDLLLEFEAWNIALNKSAFLLSDTK